MPRRLAWIAALVLLVSVIPAPAAAATVACRPGAGSPRCTVWTGRVDWVPDGDTLVIRVGRAAARSIRLIGVQAMEQHRYSPSPARRSGECHALEATARVEQLVKAGKGVVRLTARRAASASRGRPLRSIAVRIGGRWVDLGTDLVRRGYALALGFPGEDAWDATYVRAAADAAGQRKGLWDDDSCGAGPSPGATLTVRANPEGDEWARVGNAGSRAVDLSGWWVRDSGLRRYTFARGTVVPAGGRIYVHAGAGRDTATHKYWGLPAPIFTDPGSGSDGAYLFDPQGDLRRSFVYPCVARCGSPLTDKIELTIKYGGIERITVTDVSGSPVDLQGHVAVGGRYRYRFDEPTILQPGESISLGTGRDALDDAGGAVRLQTADMWTVACRWWGTGRC
ncbi:lamin tail domain-containing protein [Actinoplanes sp. NPDC020271]|uniref:lamin tail domain-containing protein n=1 Tax=Actinoplanes sp. NPDC020271 TaxID=3363896 RepID=UPI0037ACB656